MRAQDGGALASKRGLLKRDKVLILSAIKWDSTNATSSKTPTWVAPRGFRYHCLRHHLKYNWCQSPGGWVCILKGGAMRHRTIGWPQRSAAHRGATGSPSGKLSGYVSNMYGQALQNHCPNAAVWRVYQCVTS